MILYALVLMSMIIAAIRDIIRQQVLLEVAPLIDRSLRDYRQNVVPLLTLSALALFVGNIPLSSYGIVCIVLLMQIVPLHLFPVLFWDVFPTPILPAIAHPVLLVIIVLGVFNVGNTLLNWGIIQALQCRSSAGHSIRLEDALPRQRWGTIVRLSLMMSLPSFFATLPILAITSMTSDILLSGPLRFIIAIGMPVGYMLTMQSAWFRVLGAPVMFFDTAQPLTALRHSSSMFIFHGKGFYLYPLTLGSLWATGWLMIGGLFALSLLPLWLVGGFSSVTLGSLVALVWVLGNVFVAPLLAIGSLHHYNAVRERFAERPMVEITRTSLAWEQREITFTAVQSFPDGLVVLVQVDEEEVAYARSTLGKSTIAATIAHAGQMHHLTCHTTPWKRKGRWLSVSQATLQLDGEVIHEEQLQFHKELVKQMLESIKHPPRQRVRLCQYNPAWVDQFRTESERLAAVLGEEVLAIHHIGSTAIPTICAKPIIDILVEVRDIERIDRYNHALFAQCYDAWGEHGVAGRRFFAKGIPILCNFHVHMFQRGHPEITQYLAFRDYLIARPEEAQRYAQLKEQLVRQFPEDRQRYTEGKSGFVQVLTARALRWYEAEAAAQG